MAELNLTPLRKALAQYAGSGRSGLLPTLHTAQNIYGYLPEPVVVEVAQALKVPLADVHGVIEFYTMFYTQPAGSRILRVCSDPACALQGSETILAAVHAQNKAKGELGAPGSGWTVERSPCLGLCNHAPAANIGLHNTDSKGDPKPTPRSLPLRLQPNQIDTILQAPETIPERPLIDYIGGEPRLTTALCGTGKAATLAEYEAAGGMQALKQWIGGRRSPGSLIAEIKAAGLVGMGGAAFPTGLKWESAASAAATPKYFVVNADESEPGTFKDRILLEGDPCRVLEGAILGAYAIDSHQAYVYVRGEYAQAHESLETAVGALYTAGYLGSDILGSGFSLNVELRSGAGAYICGEETALLASIEGERGFPRLRPPFPTTHGLFGKPTVINNVETLTKAAYILTHGADTFRQLGTRQSPGTKLFCLSGDIAQPGVYEVPLGTRLRHLIEDLGGGVVGGELQVSLMGGAAGVFAGPESLDIPLSFEDLRAADLVLGSGVVMIFNEHRGLKQVLLNLAQFFAHESCGKCYPCQLGTQRQMEILQRAVDDRTKPGDKAQLADIGWTMTDASICGLGQTAASAVLSAMKLKPELFAGG